nr:HD domain-containing phosphohydrolase [Bdellovibrionales bacterium]
FHDIGKARIPVEILVKPGRLDKAEIEVMKSHPELSAEMIMAWQHVPFFRFLLPGIRYHHEKIDGGGYPNAIRGEAIPLFARIIAVVDGFDAMTNQRPYRNPLPEEKAIQEIRDFSGKQFDMRIAAEFLKLLPEYKKEDQKENSQELVVARLIKAA